MPLYALHHKPLSCSCCSTTRRVTLLFFLLLLCCCIAMVNSSSSSSSSSSLDPLASTATTASKNSNPKKFRRQSMSSSGAVSWTNSGEFSIVPKKSNGLGARLILHPPEVRYAFGFFTTSRPGAFVLAIYLHPRQNVRHRRRVWCAADEKQVPILVGENARLELSRHGFMLADAQGRPLWSAAGARYQPVGGVELREDGNMVLYSEHDGLSLVWESFKSPVDVLLPGQFLVPGMQLVSGPYSLVMEASGLVLYHGTSKVWTWSVCSSNNKINNNNNNKDDINNRSKRSEMIELNRNGKRAVHGRSCTRSTYAQLSQSGLHLIHGGGGGGSDKDDLSCGCDPGSYDPIKVLSGHAALALLLSDSGVVHIDVECSENDSLKNRSQRFLTRRRSCELSEKEREKPTCNICSDASTCHCSALISAERVRSLLVKSDGDGQNSVHSQGHNFGRSAVGGRSLMTSLSMRKQPTTSRKYKATVALSGLFGSFALAILAVLCAEKKPPKTPGAQSKKAESKDVFPLAVIPQKFTYSSLRKITDNFNKQLGDGGFGGVYEGHLKDGTKVAVKVLEQSSTQGEKEFKAEMTTMASIRHINILQLRGYCAEKKHRVLVYDFMPNGSLDRWLFQPPGKEGILDWTKRFSIALGTAKGLAYLHEECNQQIIHLDVKPENILLDHNFIAKVADFGLSKLIDRDKSKVVTNMRGTPGYLAPEWMHQSSVTTKADVYSFGMVLLELICGRETIDLTKGSEQWYLPAWAVRMVEEGRPLELVDNQLQEEIEYFYGDDAKRSIRTALCCIQEDPAQRPKMSRIVQMLEGVIEPKIPQLSRLPLQPATAASRLKDKLAALADAISQEEGSFHPFGEEPDHAGNEPSFNAWGLNGPVAGQARTILKARNQPCIPPWPLKGDVVMVRGSGKGGEFAHAVIRDVKIRTQQVRLALLHRIEDNRWGVLEEESLWRQWNVMVRTLEFWVPLKWTTLPGYGPQKFPMEWIPDQQKKLSV